MWSLIRATRYSHSGSYQNLRESTPNQLEGRTGDGVQACLIGSQGALC